MGAGEAKKKRKAWKIALPVGIAGLLGGLVLAFLLFRVSPVDVDAYFADSASVKVREEKDYYFFDSPSADRALLFYPGGKIHERSYAPILREIAEGGVDVYCFHMPCYLAVFAIDRAEEVLSQTPYSQVAVGGHSLGGAMAAEYLHRSERLIQGLALFAAYSAADLTEEAGLSVFSTYGTKDQILNMGTYEKNLANLPRDRFTELVVENGNHSRIASYGDVLEDGIGVIPKEEQWSIMSQGFLSWMDSL